MATGTATVTVTATEPRSDALTHERAGPVGGSRPFGSGETGLC
jgi:hypothetical protein